MRAADVKTDALLALLCARFPRAFFRYEQRRVPLKIGIHHDLLTTLDGEVDAQLLSKVLGHYCRNAAYLRAQKAGVARVDLNGEAAGAVTPEQAANAARAIAGLKAKRRKPAPAPPPPAVPIAAPQRDGLAALKRAAQRRKQAMGSAP
jgi:sRNA-binding protein